MTKTKWRPFQKQSVAEIRNKWERIYRERLLSLLYPLCCPVCDGILAPEETEDGIHFECASKLYPVNGAVCMHCGRPFGQINPINETYEYCQECVRRGYVPNGRSAIRAGMSVYVYKGEIKTSMYRFKYSNKREYASYFAKQACRLYRQRILNKYRIEAIVPVPMYLPKQKKRGYNQAESFAEALAREMDIPVDKDLVIRVRDTTPQKELSDTERKNNLKNAFQNGKSIVKYKSVLVVDDIYTTGCTAEAVADVLKKRGITDVYFLSICIGEYL